MKPLVMLKMPILLGAFGAALMFSPACKAQEVSPEQFEDRNTVPFEIASKPGVAHKAELAKPKAVTTHAPARAKRAEPVQTAQLTPIHEVSKHDGQDASTVADKRKEKKQ
jgi:hypothetical protein